MEVYTENPEKTATQDVPTHANGNSPSGGVKRRSHGLVNPALPILVGVIAIAAIGIYPRMQNQQELNKEHEALTSQVAEVQAVVATPGSEKQNLSLPGDLQPIQNIPVYARANGYLLKRFVDIGDNVQTGELLAIIDTPELDQQVQQAMAGLRAAEANLASAISDRENYSAQLFAADATIKQNRTNLEYSTTEVQRYKMLAGEGAVSYEQRDQALRQYNSDTAAIEVAQHNRQAQVAQVASSNARIAAARQQVESSQANLSQLKALQNFQKVVAPADGVITNRMVDAGALVAAGGAQGTTQILSMAKTDTLRIYVDVPQSDYRYIHNGDKADLLLQEFPGQTFEGTVTNIAGSLNSVTRTLQTEIRIDNKKHILKPGSYAEVRFHFDNPNPPVMVPSNAAVTKNDGLYVGVINGGKIGYHKVEVARDYGNNIAISQGLKANDVVALDPPDSLTDGSNVKVKMAKAVATTK
jgi:RND family efflux transporter MFP subunit